MTKPKKWYLESTGSGIVLKSDGGECIKKRNAKQAMRIVLEVSVPAPEMCTRSQESILVSCKCRATNTINIAIINFIMSL